MSASGSVLQFTLPVVASISGRCAVLCTMPCRRSSYTASLVLWVTTGEKRGEEHWGLGWVRGGADWWMADWWMAVRCCVLRAAASRVLMTAGERMVGQAWLCRTAWHWVGEKRQEVCFCCKKGIMQSCR